MRTTHECLAKAEQCEGLARATSDECNKRVLRETAKHWRTLAKAAPATWQETVPASTASITSNHE